MGGGKAPGEIGAGRYLAVMGVTFALGLAAAWAWVVAMPLAFLDPEYPYWLAKQRMLAACDLGSVLVLGDSRAAVDVIPARLGASAANLAVGGGEAIEADAALSRALACPDPPRRVVISFDPWHFVHADLFWERTARFGFLSLAELRALRATGERLGDASFAAPRNPDGLAGPLRDLAYAARFPPLYGASLAKGGVVLRLASNRRALAAGLAARGQYYFGTGAGSDAVALDGAMTGFVPLPVLDAYFGTILARLAARGIPADFVAMPVNEETARSMSPAMLAGFAAYLRGWEARYPGFRVVGPLLTAWPDRYFGDGFGHLNPQGAALFSDWFAGCLAARMAGGEACAPPQPGAVLAAKGG
ncbi:MAG: hypothetical protein JSR21_04745 [Proteobacteria bacterium]|nr:hypothetical protein [Pseudomonadota bacterium]